MDWQHTAFGGRIASRGKGVTDAHKRSITWAGLCLITFLVLGLPRLFGYARRGDLQFVDDAYYYFVVARWLVESGVSTFDGIAPTNGYHPLWQFLITLIFRVTHESLLAVKLVELLLLTGSVYLTLRLIARRNDSLVLALITTFVCVYGIQACANNGMETSLLVFCFTLLIWASDVTFGRSGLANTALLSALTIACIGARLDTGVFTVPVLLLVLPTYRDRVWALAMIGSCGLLYACLNEVMFGVAVPISGYVKWIGGLQLNRPFWVQVSAFHVGNLLHGIPWLGLFALVPLSLIASAFFVGPGRIERRVIIGLCIGMACYVVKLGFLSSWQVWEWYTFPTSLFFIPLLMVLALRWDWVMQRRLGQAVAGALILAGTVLFGFKLATAGTARPNSLFVFSREAADDFAPLLKGQRMAMGDRAGSFAYFYPGSVTQLEGLVSDRAYLDVLTGQTDLRAYLCDRRVGFVIDYEDSSASHDETRVVPVIRPLLSQFRTAGLVVRPADRLATFTDKRVMNGAAAGFHDDAAVLWRLDCP